LERSNAELERFAYLASHDLQEPLRMITGYTNLLSKRYHGKLDASADEFIDFAVDGANRMRVLINDLLTYSRVSSNGKKLAPTDCELVLSQTLTGLELAIQESAGKVTHDPFPIVNGDDVQLRQLFQNLIGNALKYRNGHGSVIHVGCDRRESDWLLSVRDNGIGIDPRFAEKIFVIFQRLHTREQYPGAGIGLAVCKCIVERHGGTIWVESEPGKGSTFYFTLPA
jgi:light-regulated signal transduction histidine kinase (bacteriophytochrome)